MLRFAWLALLALSASAHAVPREECFPFEKLPPRLQPQARELLLKALDREALYTFAGDIKPWSSGITTIRWSESEPAEPAELADLKRVMGAFRCGSDLEGGVQVFAKSYDGVRYAESFVLKRSLLGKAVRARAAFFAKLGIDPEGARAMPLETLLSRVENAERYDRFFANGIFFGYPDAAVSFFDFASRHEDASGEFVERAFRSIPTFHSADHQFVWAVPLGSRETEQEARMRQEAEPVLATYSMLRGAFGEANILELIREWYHDQEGDHDPAHARYARYAR